MSAMYLQLEEAAEKLKPGQGEGTQCDHRPTIKNANENISRICKRYHVKGTYS